MYAGCCVLDLLTPERATGDGSDADGAGDGASPTAAEGQRALRSLLRRGRSALAEEVQRRSAGGGAPDKLSHRKLIRQAVAEAAQQNGCEVRRQVCNYVDIGPSHPHTPFSHTVAPRPA